MHAVSNAAAATVVAAFRLHLATQRNTSMSLQFLSDARIAHHAAVALLLITAAACSGEATSPNSPRMVYGAGQTLGNGTARTYVALDASGKPVSIGVAIVRA